MPGPLAAFEEHGPSLAEEVANTITHGLGLLLSLVGVPLLILGAWAQEEGPLVEVSIFGATLVLTYLASTLYHLVRRPVWKRVLRVLDHVCIYLLIAGTYTPFVLAFFSEGTMLTLLYVIWGLALAGTVFKIFFTGRFPILSTGLYVAMGWMSILAIESLIVTLPGGCLMWLLAGGLFYTGGVVFFAWQRLPYNHAVWHVFVLAGSACHYLAVMRYVV